MKQKSNSKISVGVLFGGRSSEHEISILTALQAISAIDTLNYQIIPVYLHFNGKWYTGDKLLNKAFYRQLPSALQELQEVTLLPDPHSKGLVDLSSKNTIPIDVYFLCFHGQYGEDGCIQGLLELKNAPYTGCSPIASAIAMNKYICKIYLQGHQIPALPGVLVKKQEVWASFQKVQKRILTTPGLEKFPLFVKPCHLGSSIGISAAKDASSLQTALAKAFLYDDEVLIEPCLTHFMEINVAVLDGNPPRASIVEMPKSSGTSLTYEDKYLRGGSKNRTSEGMASLSRVIDPDIDPAMKQQISTYAVQAFQALGCSGVSRFDFMIDLTNGQIYFNELNPIPGSLAFYLWEKSHPPCLYTDVIHQMIEQAFQRRKIKLSLQQDLGFKALK